MQIELESRPSFGMATVTLDKGEAIVAESGAMVAMSPSLQVKSGLMGAGGGPFDWFLAALTGLARKYLAGESLLVNTFRATKDGEQVMLAPAMVGDVVRVKLQDDHPVTVQAESFLASDPQIKQHLVWGGFSMLLSGEGAFFLRCTGAGDLLLNSYGAIEKVEVDGGYVVDTGHVVAWEGPLNYRIRKAGGFAASVLSGEGLVLEFTGKGTVWLQTRNLSALVSWLTPYFRGR